MRTRPWRPWRSCRRTSGWTSRKRSAARSCSRTASLATSTTATPASCGSFVTSAARRSPCARPRSSSRLGTPVLLCTSSWRATSSTRVCARSPGSSAAEFRTRRRGRGRLRTWRIRRRPQTLTTRTPKRTISARSTTWAGVLGSARPSSGSRRGSTAASSLPRPAGRCWCSRRRSSPRCSPSTTPAPARTRADTAASSWSS
mmetsp:Transcript_120986/g.324775  ORF Transcript_120986/g.324775 Transcript_120986/m.324775 type:complete len:201 (+) Transcript_120986:431-1033(+)